MRMSPFTVSREKIVTASAAPACVSNLCARSSLPNVFSEDWYPEMMAMNMRTVLLNPRRLFK